MRNKVNNLKTFAKKRCYVQTESNTENDSSNNIIYWKTFLRPADTIPVLRCNIDGTGKYNFTDEEKTNCLNDYFTSVSNLGDSNIDISLFACKNDASIDRIQIEQH